MKVTQLMLIVLIHESQQPKCGLSKRSSEFRQLFKQTVYLLKQTQYHQLAFCGLWSVFQDLNSTQD
jgi:hypothetical protein